MFNVNGASEEQMWSFLTFQLSFFNLLWPLRKTQPFSSPWNAIAKVKLPFLRLSDEGAYVTLLWWTLNSSWSTMWSMQGFLACTYVVFQAFKSQVGVSLPESPFYWSEMFTWEGPVRHSLTSVCRHAWVTCAERSPCSSSSPMFPLF